VSGLFLLFTTFVHTFPRLSLWKNTFRTPFLETGQHLPRPRYEVSLGTLWTKEAKSILHQLPRDQLTSKNISTTKPASLNFKLVLTSSAAEVYWRFGVTYNVHLRSSTLRGHSCEGPFPSASYSEASARPLLDSSPLLSSVQSCIHLALNVSRQGYMRISTPVPRLQVTSPFCATYTLKQKSYIKIQLLEPKTRIESDLLRNASALEAATLLRLRLCETMT
jgi:hypothetical protein